LLRLSDEEDERAVAALTKQAEYIGKGLRLISATLAPELILIAGDIVAAWTHFGPVIEEAFSNVALAGLKPRLTPIHEAEVARLRGAAILVLLRRSSQCEVKPSTPKPRQRASETKKR
jgi:predicted NBD/HSP70 family sugar kinase